jgi:hypothetical protein
MKEEVGTGSVVGLEKLVCGVDVLNDRKALARHRKESRRKTVSISVAGVFVVGRSRHAL